MHLPALVLLALLAADAPVPVAPPAVSPLDEPPAGVAASLAALLAPSGLRVHEGEAARVDLWLRAELPLAATPATGLGIEHGTLQPGALVALVRLAGAWTDYKGTQVPAGTYTARYAIQPADGDHMGVTEHRDFLLLVPAKDDVSPEPLAPADLTKASRAASGAKHPAVLALLPGTFDSAPALRVDEAGHLILAVRAGAHRLDLVLVGHGEVEGY